MTCQRNTIRYHPITHIFSHAARQPTTVEQRYFHLGSFPSVLSFSRFWVTLFVSTFFFLMSPFYYLLSLAHVFRRICSRFRAFFSFWLVPCGVGFDTIPYHSIAFDVRHKADSTQWDTPMIVTIWECSWSATPRRGKGQSKLHHSFLFPLVLG